MFSTSLANLPNYQNSLNGFALGQHQEIKILDERALPQIDKGKIPEVEIDSIIIRTRWKDFLHSTWFISEIQRCVSYYIVRIYAKKYLDLGPGPADGDSELYSLTELIKNPRSTYEEIQACRSILERRLDEMSSAERLMFAFGKFQPVYNRGVVSTCKTLTNFLDDMTTWLEDRAVINKWKSIGIKVNNADVFGAPIIKPSRIWDKPPRCIAAALFAMPDASSEVVSKKLAEIMSLPMSEIVPATLRLLRPQETEVHTSGQAGPATKSRQTGSQHQGKEELNVMSIDYFRDIYKRIYRERYLEEFRRREKGRKPFNVISGTTY